jgi:pimeloyl-ACP methyl ester carboxylesterase
MGGYVALALAAQSPGRVRRVATLGTKLAWSPDVAARETRRLDATAIVTKVPRFAEQLERRHRGAGGWEGVLARTAALLESLGSDPVVTVDVLRAIATPVRLIVGDRDATVTVQETCDASKALPQGELCVLPNTPHPLEQARVHLLAGVLNDFFGSARA